MCVQECYLLGIYDHLIEREKEWECITSQCWLCYSWSCLVAMVDALGHSLRDLRLVLQLGILHSELFVCFSPAVHVKVAVGALLVAVFLFGGLHAWGSRDPQTLVLVVTPVSVITAE